MGLPLKMLPNCIIPPANKALLSSPKLKFTKPFCLAESVAFSKRLALPSTKLSFRTSRLASLIFRPKTLGFSIIKKPVKLVLDPSFLAFSMSNFLNSRGLNEQAPRLKKLMSITNLLSLKCGIFCVKMRNSLNSHSIIIQAVVFVR